MNVIVFGATGMVGQGALRECLLDPDVERVLSIGRSPTGQTHPKLEEMVRKDLADLSDVEAELAGYDACFFCLGVTSAGMSEKDYRRVTYEIPVGAAATLVKASPQMTFIYISGVGTDSTEKGRTMWARVKGAAENALLKVPFRRVYAFRPGFIEPLHGIRSRTRAYNVLYAIFWPLVPVLRLALGESFTTTERLGRALLVAAKSGAPKAILEPKDFNALVPRA